MTTIKCGSFRSLWKWLFVLALTGFWTEMASASPSAALDHTFAVGSGAGYPIPGATNWGQIQTIAVQSDGKILAGGQDLFRDLNGTAVNHLCRLNVDGSLDAAFLSNLGHGPRDGATGDVKAIALQPDGKILIGGQFITVDGTSRSGVARLNANGSLDTNFLAAGGGVGGIGLRYVNGMVLQSNGRILIGGAFTNYLGTVRLGLARLNTNGTLDSSFNFGSPAGLGSTKVVKALGIDSTGKIYVGGTFTNWLGLSTPGIVRLNTNGTLDFSFVPSHAHVSPSVESIEVLGDGRVLIGGSIEGDGVQTTRYLARLHDSGDIDNSYPASAPNDLVMDIAPWPGGGHLIAGRFRTVGGQSRGQLALLDDAGNVDAGFAPAPYSDASNDPVHLYSMGVAPDGKIAVGGWFTNYPNNTLLNGQNYSGMARLIGGHTGGAGTIQFADAELLVNEAAGTATISVSRFGGLAGAVNVNFSSINGTAEAGSDYTATDGTVSWAAGEGGIKTITVPITSDVVAEGKESFTFLLSDPTGGAILGTLTNATITILDDDSAPTIATQPRNASAFLGFSTNFFVVVGRGPSVTYQWLSNSVPIVGGTNLFFNLSNIQTNFAATYAVVVSNIFGATTSDAAVLTVQIAAGLPDPTFAMSGNGLNQGVNDLLFHTNGSIVAVGNFNQYGGVSIPSCITRLNLNGSRDANFPPTASGANVLIQTVAQYPDGKLLIAGSFSTYAGVGRSRVARLNSDGSLDSTFAPSSTAATTIYAVLPQPDGSAYVGDISSVRRLAGSGANDTNFAQTSFVGQVYALAQQTDGKILAAPFRTTFPGGSEIIRLNTNGTRDLTFGNVGRLNSQVQSMKVLPDGRILVVGGFTTLIKDDTTNSAIRYIMMLTSNGVVDVSFNVGTGPDAAIIDSFIQPDGRILVAGAFTNWNEKSVGRFMRLLPNGQVDSSFITGSGADNLVRAIAMDSAGRIAIGGTFATVNGQTRGRVTLLTDDAGSLQFPANTRQVNEHSGSITISVERVAGSRGTVSVNYVTVFGSATASDFAPVSGLLIWTNGESGLKTFAIPLNDDSDTETDESFSVVLTNIVGATAGLYTNQVIKVFDNESLPRITLHPSSATVAEETSHTFSATAESALLISYQWRSNGVDLLDATNSTLKLSDLQSNLAAVYSVRVSNANGFADSSNAFLTIISSPTHRDSTFINPAFNGAVRALVPLGDGRVMVGGGFTQPAGRIVLLHSNGVVDATFTNTANGDENIWIYDIERDRQGRWLIAGQFSQFGGVNATNVVRLKPDFSVDTNFLVALDIAPNDLVHDVAIGADGKIWLAGEFTSIGGAFGHQKVARLHDDGSIDLTFFPRIAGGSGSVFRVIPLPHGGALLGGNFTSYDGFGANLRKCLVDGRSDKIFAPFLSGAVYDVALLPDGSVVAAGDLSIPSARMMKFTERGGVDTTFLQGVTASDSVRSILLQPDGRIAAGGAFATMGIHSNRFTRVNADGIQDNSINVGSGFNGDVLKLAQEHTGEIWAGGAFTTFKGAAASYLVRLTGDQPAVAIGQQPFDAIVAPEDDFTFSISAAGSGPLTYKWMKDGLPLSNGGGISGATSPSLTLNSVTTANEGSYSVVVSNNAGAFVISRTALLQVKSAPSILLQPTGGIFPLNGKLQLSARAEGALPLHYQWRKNGASIGSDTPILEINAASISDSGNYEVVFSNRFGAVTSAVASVVVQPTPATVTDGFPSDAGTGSSNEIIYALQPLPDGRLLVGGAFGSIRINGGSVELRQNVAIFDTNGVAAPFNPSADGQVHKIVRQRDGKILVAGSFTNINGINRRFLARFHADLSFDHDFHDALYRNAATNGPNGLVNDIALQPDGKILIAGGFTNVRGQLNTTALARLNADGSVDDSFVSEAASPAVSGLVNVLPDGRILFAGTVFYGGHVSAVMRLSSSGAADARFSVTTDGNLHSFAVETNGAILVGGNFKVINGWPNALLARVMDDGSVDTNFAGGSLNVTALNQATIRTIALQDDGKILAGGTFLEFGPFRNGVARFNADGTPDSSFLFQQGVGDDPAASVWKIALFADGGVALGGRFSRWEGVMENSLVILRGDATALGFASQPFDQFVLPGTTVQFAAQAVGTSGIGYQWFRGSSLLVDGGNISGATTSALTIVGATTANAALYSVRITNQSGTTLSLPAELFILGAPVFREQPVGGTYFLSNTVTFRARAIGVSPLYYQWLFNSNAVPNATNSSLVMSGLALTNAGSFQLVASNSTGVSTSAVATLIVRPSPASLSATWPHPAGVSNGVYALAPIDDGRIVVGGQFTTAGTNGTQTARLNLALFNTNGTVDTAFNPAPDNRVQVIRRDGAGGFLVGGWFGKIGGENRSFFARLHADGILDTSFLANLGSGPNNFVHDIAVQPDGKILLGGTFATVSGFSYPNIVRLNTNGTIDGSFRLPSVVQQVRTISILPDGRFYIGGAITVSNRQNIIRLLSNGAVDSSFAASTDGAVNKAMGRADGGVVIGGDFTRVNGESALHLAQLAANGTRNIGWPHLEPNASVEDMAIQANGKLIIVGHFSEAAPPALMPAAPALFQGGIIINHTGHFPAQHSARFNVDGSLDTTFLPGSGFNGVTRSVALEADGRVWIGGAFTSYNNTLVNNLVLLKGDDVIPGNVNSPFETWAQSYGLVSGNDGPNDDPDGDGIVNAFEFYFGTNPLNSGSIHEPVATSVAVGGQTYPAVTFLRTKNLAGVTLFAQAASAVNFPDSLGTVLHAVVDVGGEFEQVIIRSAVNDAAQSKQFLRIQLSIP